MQYLKLVIDTIDHEMEFLHQLICDKVIELNLYLQQFCMISQGSNIKYMDGSTNVV